MVTAPTPAIMGQGQGREADYGKEPHEEIDAGGNHGGGVNQGGDRGRSGHGIRQPDGQRQLGGFAGGGPEEQEAEQGRHPRTEVSRCGR